MRYGLQAPRHLAILAVWVAGSTLALILVPDWWRLLFLIPLVYFAYHFILTIVSSTAWYRKRLNRHMLKLSGAKENDKVLDIGCGGGSLSIALAKRIEQGEVWGIDIWSQDQLASSSPGRAAQNASVEGVGRLVNVVSADARALPFPDECFDIVVSVLTIHNIKGNREMAIMEIARVLKNPGIVVIADIYSWRWTGLLSRHGLEITRTMKAAFLPRMIVASRASRSRKVPSAD